MDDYECNPFALSDDELPISSSHSRRDLTKKQLLNQIEMLDAQVEKRKSEIETIQKLEMKILKTLQSEEQWGEVISSDSDSDCYTAEGEFVIKESKCREITHRPLLVVTDNWKRMVFDKWVIGIEVANKSAEILRDLRFYVAMESEDELSGISNFWTLKNNRFWQRIEEIPSGGVATATVVLDLPNFDKKPYHEVIGTLSFQADGKSYQTPMPATSLSTEETLGESSSLKFTEKVLCNILTLKCISIETIVGIQVDDDPENDAQLLEFLQQKGFKEISDGIYVVEGSGTLMHALIEILSKDEEEIMLRITSKHASQMNIILRFFRDEFPDLTVKEDITDLSAVASLIEELQTYCNTGTIMERLTAKLKTDLCTLE